MNLRLEELTLNHHMKRLIVKLLIRKEKDKEDTNLMILNLENNQY
jgi:hypothetical protein